MKIQRQTAKLHEKVWSILTPKTPEEFQKMMPLEMCTCGHQRREHSDLVIGKLVIGEGHGNCMYGGSTMFCTCQKFTWNGGWSQKW